MVDCCCVILRKVRPKELNLQYVRSFAVARMTGMLSFIVQN